MTHRNVVIGAVASVLVIAAAFGLLVLLDRSQGIDLPDELAGVPARDSEEALANVDEDRRAELRDAVRAAADYSSEKFSDAYGGAEVDTRFYTSADDGFELFTVIAIADNSGPLLPETNFDDPAYTRLTPRIDRVTFDDDVECLVSYNPVPVDDGEDGTEADPGEPVRSTCQRSRDGLTVRVIGGGDAVDTDQVIDVLDAAWDELD